MTPPDRPAARTVARLALLAGILVACIGAAYFAAWLSGTMASLADATTITMKANASLCLLLAGLALALLVHQESPPAALRLGARFCASVVLAIAAATLVEHIGRFDLGIDQLLATEPPGAPAVVGPNRMGPPASFCFTFLGTALLLLTRRSATRLRSAHQPLAAAAAVTALVPITGYLYGANELYGLARFTGIAWPTAASLFVLALGVFFARPNEGLAALVTSDGPGGVLTRRLVPPMVLMPLVLGWLRLAAERGGWLDAATGTSLTMVFFIVALTAMVLIAARLVARSESVIRRSEDAARRQLLEIQSIYDSAHVGLCVFDRNLRYLRINERLAAINGVSAADHLGKSVEEVIPSAAPLARHLAERIVRTGEGVTDVEFSGTTAAEPGVQRSWTEQWLPLKDASGQVVAINVVVEEITERKRAEEVLRRSEERFRALVRASSQVVYSMSPDWSEMLTLQGGDFLAVTGRPNRNWLQEYIHPDDQQRVLEAVGRAVRSGAVFDLEHRVRQLDGTLGWTSSRAVPVHNAAGEIVEWFGAASDITARKSAEEAVRQSQSRLTAALEIAELGIWEYDVAAARATHDQRCREVFGISDEQVSSDRMFDLVHPHDRPRVQQEVAAALDPRGNGLYDTEYRIVRPDGTPRWVAVRGHASREGSDAISIPARLVGTVMDITGRKEAEEALREANRRLAEADRRKDEFIAILSHELRNPLAPIRYALPLLERERLGDAAARAVSVVNRQVNHLARLVDDILDVSRLTRGQIELRRERVTLGSILSAATEAASPAIVAGRHTLSAALPDEPIWVDGDSGRITQALTNLLNNSAKYTPAGGQIVLEATREDGQAIIRVRDNGMGIDPQLLPTLFEMFRQLNRADRPQGGLGVGLAFAKQLVEMHGGSIEAHSEGVGRGSEFVVRLPVIAEADSSDLQATPESTRVASGRLKVLVVDDNADFVQMLAASLESAGHEVRKALDGRSAIGTAVSYRPDVVLLDLGLPVMGGLEVARELRRRPEMAGVRLVALTGWGQAQDRRRTEEAGFDHHLTKPTDPQELQALLHQFAVELAARQGDRQGRPEIAREIPK
jgi:PAS domain S-box-containing protein